MTQEKLRRVITACVSAATVLLVFLFGYLIFQWVSLGVQKNKINKLEKEIASLEMQLTAAEEQEEGYHDKFYLQWKLDELEQKKNLIEGK